MRITTNEDQPVIIYDLFLISLPLLMSGAIFGVAFNHFLPEGIIVLIMIKIIYDGSIKSHK